MQDRRDGRQREMELAEIEIYWSFAIHSALTLSLGSAVPKNGCGWLVCWDRSIDTKPITDWFRRADGNPVACYAEACTEVHPRFRATDYKETPR
jgi:hypothetical protein